MVSLGYKQLSISPANVPTIRYLCNRLEMDLLNTVRHKILNSRKNSEIERYMIEVLESVDPALIEIK